MGENKLALSAFAKNLMDTHTPVFTGASGQWQTSEPRMVGLEASLEF